MTTDNYPIRKPVKMLRKPCSEYNRLNGAFMISGAVAVFCLFFIFLPIHTTVSAYIGMSLLVASFIFAVIFLRLYKLYSPTYKKLRADVKAYIEYYYDLELSANQLWRLSTQHEYHPSGVFHWYSPKEPFTSQLTDITLRTMRNGSVHLTPAKLYLYIDDKEALLASPQGFFISFQKHIKGDD